MASQSRAAEAAPKGLDFGINEWLVDEQYERYLHDPDSVGRTWREFFASPVSLPAQRAESHEAPAPEESGESAIKAIRVAALIDAYRARGHLAADTDPISDGHGTAQPVALEHTAHRLSPAGAAAHRARRILAAPVCNSGATADPLATRVRKAGTGGS